MKFHFKPKKHPDAFDKAKVGTYKLECYSGGGYFYDEVLEYRVWYKSEGELTCASFNTYLDAKEFAKTTAGVGKPIALVLQKEYIHEPIPGIYKHISKPRISEWQVEWLRDSKRKPDSIQNFLKNIA